MKGKDFLFIFYVAVSVSYFIQAGNFIFAGLGIVALLAQFFNLRFVRMEEKRMLEKLKDLLDPTKP